jgi:signal transduction histidine kinase
MHAASVDANAEVGPGRPAVAAVEPIVAGVAHDFGNLLAVITNYLSLASRRVEDPATAELLEQVRVAAKRAARLNRQLHDLGECGSLSVQPVPVNDFVRDARPLLAEGLEEPWHLRLDLADEPITAMASRNGLEMALRHLVDNAREAMPHGGPIEIATRRLGDAEGAPVELSVSDEGAGMPADVVARATEPRFSTRPKGQVSGLGLTIVDRVVGSLGGALHIDSTVGAGTTVRLRLRGGSIDG